MKTEIKNIQEYNPEYRHDGTLVWKKIGEPVGKRANTSEVKNNIRQSV